MNIPRFEDLPITTMTLVMSLTSAINMAPAFHLLPITRIQITQTRESSKCKLPHCDIPGAILSMRHGNNTRGIIRSIKRPFKNAVTIDISTTRKNISMKLSPYSIQMCGASSRADGMEAATHIINHLKNTQRLLNKLKIDPDLTNQCIAWVKAQTQGTPVNNQIIEEIVGNNITLNVRKNKADHYIISAHDPIPDHLDAEIVHFLLSMTEDFIFHGDMCRKLDFMMSFPDIIEDSLEIKSVNEAMVNYNYSLGFEVDRARLNQYIDGKNGFLSRYNNALVNSVTIELPYEPAPGSTIKRRKNKVPHHTFLVYRSGSVTASGPSSELMHPAYNLFMQTISEGRNLVEYVAPEIRPEVTE